MGKTIPLLRDLVEGPLPKVVQDRAEIPAIDLLRGVGWIVADLSDPAAGPAVVREVTFAGQAALAQAQRLAS